MSGYENCQCWHPIPESLWFVSLNKGLETKKSAAGFKTSLKVLNWGVSLLTECNLGKTFFNC